MSDQSTKTAIAGGVIDPVSELDFACTQSRLKEFEYLKGSIDGVFGDKTKTALAQYQKENGFEETWIQNFHGGQIAPVSTLYTHPATLFPSCFWLCRSAIYYGALH